METQRERDELEACEVDIAARLFLRTDEGPPTCPPPTPEEAAAEDAKYGLSPVAFDFGPQREFIRRSMEACRLAT